MDSIKELSLVVSLSIALTGCGGGGGGSSSINTETHSIVQNWIENKTNCDETRIFRDDGSYQINFGGDVGGTGTYEYAETVSSGSRHELAIAINVDNNILNCDGLTTGLPEEETIFVLVSNSTEVLFYNAAEGGDIIADLYFNEL